jgi:hypothetical protein
MSKLIYPIAVVCCVSAFAASVLWANPPSSGTWAETASLNTARHPHTATLLHIFTLFGNAGAVVAQQSKTNQTATATPGTPPRTVKQVFNAVEVGLFENQKDSNFPGEQMAPLQKEIVKQLVSAKAFPEVFGAGETPKTPNVRKLRLSGVITNYNPGSRAKRYFGGMGAGSTEIDSKVAFVDGETGQVLMWQNLRAMLTGGFFGGKSEDALKDYARQVVNKVKFMQYMRVPGPGEVPEPLIADTSNIVASSMPAQDKVVIPDKDWTDSEHKINQKAAEGYRLAGLTVTGAHSVEALMVRKDALAAAFEYRLLLLNAKLKKNLANDLNELAKEGYRVSPHTMVVMGKYPAVIVERSTPRFKVNYQYVMKEPLLVSSGQKDVQEMQKQGYTLIGETELLTFHILLFEKTTSPE